MLLRVLLREGERLGSRPGRQQNQEDHLDGEQADDQAGTRFAYRHFSIQRSSLLKWLKTKRPSEERKATQPSDTLRLVDRHGRHVSSSRHIDTTDVGT